MIPQDFIKEWASFVPWQTFEQVEQDLVICRALVEIFSDEFLSSSLAFRGGTALHKLFIQPQSRYSEDIDLVQIRPEPIKPTIMRLQEKLAFLGKSSVAQKNSNNTLKFRFDSEFPPSQSLRVKIETNCREHFTVLGYQQFPLEIKSDWFSGTCNITTYKIEELLGTKFRALYQRNKGRDLFDMYKALIEIPNLKLDEIIHCYKEYMNFSVNKPPSQKEFLMNMEAKMLDEEFLGDTLGLLRSEEDYDPQLAFERVKMDLMGRI